jgi:hypothetical protein
LRHLPHHHHNPGSVTNLGDNAFADCPLLGSVAILDGVTNTGYGSFSFCANLTNVTFSESITCIGSGSFQDTGLTSITIPGAATDISDSAFDNCDSLTNVTINSGVTCIGSGAFSACLNLPDIVIPASIINLGDGAFQFCTNLTSVYFGGNAPDTDKTAFEYDNNLLTTYYLSGTIGWSNTFWGYPASGPQAVLWNPRIQTGDGGFGVQSNQFGFNITGTIDFTVVVEACTNLASPDWIPLQTNTLTNGVFYFSDPQWTNFPNRYYGLGFP